MTIDQAIKTVDKLMPNAYSWETKVDWIGQVESQIYEDIISTHDNPMGIRRPRIDKNTDPNTKLIAPFPHDAIYRYWLQSMICLNNQEIGKYNNSSGMFNNALLTFRDYWHRKYMPVEHVPYIRFDNGRRMHPVPYDGRPLYSAGNPLDVVPGSVPERTPCAPVPGHTKGHMHVLDQLADIRAVDVKQQKDIDAMKKNRDTALTEEDIGEILK